MAKQTVLVCDIFLQFTLDKAYLICSFSTFVDSFENLLRIMPTVPILRHERKEVFHIFKKTKIRQILTLDYAANPKNLKLFLKRLSNYKLLIIDEWLINKPSEKDIRFIYELIDLRTKNYPTIFITQFDIDTWHERLAGGQHADSIMDRILSNHYEVPLTDTNIRKTPPVASEWPMEEVTNHFFHT